MGHIIPELEHQLYDLAVGERKPVTVPAQDAYGEVDTEASIDMPRRAFPSDVPLHTGIELELQDNSGHPVCAKIEAIADKNIRLNLNHPLAGKVLAFEITIADVRLPSEDAVAYGHVHDDSHAQASDNSVLSG